MSFILNSAAQNGDWQQQINADIDVSPKDGNQPQGAFGRIQYRNSSRVTHSFNWFHILPNAFGNEEAGFSKQMLKDRKFDNYFSYNGQKGGINRLEPRFNAQLVRNAVHLGNTDIIKLVLSEAVASDASVPSSTPFHFQIPGQFSRFGYKGGPLPIFYRQDIINSLKPVPAKNIFWKKAAFKIDFQRIQPTPIFSNYQA